MIFLTPQELVEQLEAERAAEALMSMDETLNAQLQQAHAAGVAQTPYDRAQWQAQRAMEGLMVRNAQMLGLERLGEMPWDRTIRDLREENARLIAEAAERDVRLYGVGGFERTRHADGTVTVSRMTLETARKLADLEQATARLPESDNPVVGESVVDNVVDALNRRVVPPPDRTRLRDALDKADAPQPGRAGADEALGRTIRFGGSDAA